MKTTDNGACAWGATGEVLVFLHYFGGAGQSWRWVAEHLASDYRCIALNLPGFGGAPALPEPSIKAFADFVREELQTLGVTAYTLIGHSMGGKIALQVAADAEAGTVQQLILVAPSPPTTEPMPEAEKNRMLHHPDRGEAEETVKNAIQLPLSAQQHQMVVETQLIIDPATWQWWLKEGMDHSIANDISLRNMLVTVLASGQDPVITPQVIQERVMQVLESANLLKMEQGGHLLPLEAPALLAAQIRSALSAIG